MSLNYTLTKYLIKLINPKKYMHVKNREELLKLFEKMKKKEEKHDFSKYLKKSLTVEVKQIKDTKIYFIKKGNEKKKRIVFYLFGGGFISHPSKFDIKMIEQILKETDCEIAIADYPLLMSKTLKDMCQSVLYEYEEVLTRYKSQDIVFLGFSSGASMAIYLFNYAKRIKYPLTFPKRMILSSPAGILPPPLDILKEMRRLNKKDLILDCDFIQEISLYMKENDGDLISPLSQKMENFPPMTLFMGSDEIFYPYVKLFEQKAKQDKFDLEVFIGEKLPHCYVMLTSIPECRKDLKILFERIRN